MNDVVNYILYRVLSIAHNSRGGAHYSQECMQGDLLVGTVSIGLAPLPIIQSCMKVIVSLLVFYIVQDAGAMRDTARSSGNQQFDRQGVNRQRVHWHATLTLMSLRIY